MSKKNNYCPECGSPQEKLLSIKNAAKLLDMTPNAIKGIIRRREVEFKKIKTRVRISLSELMKIIVTYPAASSFKLSRGEKASNSDLKENHEQE